ncbi:hypothetical protein NW768_007704 [Fusarium equiseti]|uniref:S-adenosylmethionine-dependent methyltransferase n=1 Tax=Fusarium equiseti TaxID=61235 RepID=A0ABQ8R887_FUSEQ|nr:hypothetical protein NW768_007704 [Fusarium equiseti]
MSYNNFFLRIVGFGEARIGMIWFMLAILMGFIANIVVLVGCASPDTQSVHLFKVGSAELVNATANVTGISPNKLQMPELPEYWYWGFSGVCIDVQTRGLFESRHSVSCKSAFPPVFSVEEMIQFSIHAHLGDSAPESLVKKKMAPWTSALAKIQDDLVDPSRPRDLMKGAAGLCVISTILSAVIMILTVFYFTLLRGILQRWMLYALALLDALLFVGCGVMVGYAMRDGPRGIIELAGMPESNIYGPGNVAFSLGALIKFVAMEVFLCLLLLSLVIVLWLIYCCFLCCAHDREKVKVKVEYIHRYLPAQDR